MPTPSKFTADRRTEILRAKRLGASNLTAARAGGIDEKTLRRWLEKGAASPEGSTYLQFFEEFEAASAVMNVRCLESVSNAIVDKPELAWKFLQAREPGFAPPVPQAPVVGHGPVLIQLAFGNGSPTGEPVGTVIDVSEVAAGPRRLPEHSAEG